MSITRSSAADISRLVSELASPSELRRETAVARLAVIGARAVSRLVAVATDEAEPVAGRMSALLALDAIADPRGVAAARLCINHPDDRLAVAAVNVLARAARGTGAEATRTFDDLTALVLDRDAPVERRLAALAGIEVPTGSGPAGREDSVLAPIYEALGTDPSSRMRARVTRRKAGAVLPIESLFENGGPGLSDDPAVAAAVVRDEGGTARVTVLRRALDAARVRERDARSDAARKGWAAVRGLLHQQLAARGSRLAVFDLREAFMQAAGPLPVGFVAAAAAVGDVTCLEPLAGAWVKAGDAASRDQWWREHLAEAFRAIVKREGLTRRHAVLKRILERWPGAGAIVASAPLT
jgi:hypothetical protein